MARPVQPLRSWALQDAPASPDMHPRRASLLGWLVTLGAALLYAVIFGWTSLQEYAGFQMHALDMGNMGQAAWNTLHGHPFFFTNMRLDYGGLEAWNTTTRLSFHVEALYPVISLVYLIHSGPESLLVLQTACIAAGAIPVFLLARDQLSSATFGVLFACLYLLFPALEAMNLYEFHPVALATPLLLLGFWLATRRHFLLFALCCVAAMGTKEEIGLIVALFGIYAAVAMKARRIGSALAFIGVFWSLFAALVVEHHYRQPGTLTYLHSRYGYLGHGLRGAVSTLLRRPGKISSTIFTWAKLRYIVHLLAPTGFLALLSPVTLLLALPTFALNVLSTEPHMFSALGDNSAEIIAVVMIASILGARRLLNLLSFWISAGRARFLVVLFLVVCAFLSQSSMGFLPGTGSAVDLTTSRHQDIQSKFVAMIPPGAAVSTQDQLDPHLSSRHFLYLFEDTGTQPPYTPRVSPARYILLDASAPTYPLPSYQLYDRAQQYLHSPDWSVQAALDGLILLKHSPGSNAIPAGFFTFMDAGSARPLHRLHLQSGQVLITGYSVRMSDQPNQYPALENFTYFMQVRRARASSLQPVVFAVRNRQLVNCVDQPLGLSWMPTNRWQTHRTYVVRMSPLQLNPDRPGAIQLYAGLTSSPEPASTSCSRLWQQHGSIRAVGQAPIGLE